MLQRLTNHRLPSTTHRVCNPPTDRRGVPRYSMPFFLHLRPDFLIETLPGSIDAAPPDRDPRPITADAYLTQRLHAIGFLNKRSDARRVGNGCASKWRDRGSRDH